MRGVITRGRAALSAALIGTALATLVGSASVSILWELMPTEPSHRLASYAASQVEPRSATVASAPASEDVPAESGPGVISEPRVRPYGSQISRPAPRAEALTPPIPESELTFAKGYMRRRAVVAATSAAAR